MVSLALVGQGGEVARVGLTAYLPTAAVIRDRDRAGEAAVGYEVNDAAAVGRGKAQRGADFEKAAVSERDALCGRDESRVVIEHKIAGILREAHVRERVDAADVISAENIDHGVQNERGAFKVVYMTVSKALSVK